MLQLVQQCVCETARTENVPAVSKPNVCNCLRVGVHDLTFGRSSLHAYFTAYRILAYQLLGLVLDACGQVAGPVVALGSLAHSAFADAVLSRNLPQRFDAGAKVQLDACPIWRSNSRAR